MEPSYQQAQQYPVYENTQWPEILKPNYVEGNHGLECDGKPSLTASREFAAIQHTHKPSILKVEDDSMRQDSLLESQMPHPARHYSHPSIQAHGYTHSYVRIDPNFEASYAQPWSVPQSGTSTPTQAYGSIGSYNQPAQYAQHAPFNFNDPVSAISMSPQSSQGGWASATSSDGVDHRGMMQSPVYRPASPHLVVRPDGIRKKNARFEIPKERNLQTIDAMIMSSTDDNEKKELKQQKRLLRNRQAA